MDPQLLNLLKISGWILILVFIWYMRGAWRQRRIELIHKERMAAMDKGIPLPELPDYSEPDRKWLLSAGPGVRGINPRWPLGAGAVSIMLGAGLCLALRLSGDEYHNQIWPFGLIGVFLGVGLMLHYSLTQPPRQ